MKRRVARLLEEGTDPERLLASGLFLKYRKTSGTSVGRYKVIAARLAALQGLNAEALINALFPEGVQEMKLLRDSALQLVGDDVQPAHILGRLRNLITQPELPDASDFVRIMSLQKSKGLTSKVVIIAGCVEGLVPFIDRDETPQEQDAITREQRRLFYVAMTRASEILVLSSFVGIDRHLAHKIGAATRFSFTLQARTIASPFLGELGPTTPAARVGAAWHSGGYA